MSIVSGAKKKTGRPKVDSEPVNTRLERQLLTALDTWIAQEPDPKPSRPEAIRLALRDWLTEKGLVPPVDVLPAITTRIEALESKIATIPDADELSPEAAMNVMRKAVAENELAKLKSRLPRPKRK